MLIQVSTAQHIDTTYHVETPFLLTQVGSSDLHTITAQERYSNAVFTDGKRSKAMHESFTNLLIYDIDNDRDDKLSLSEACLLFKDIKCLIVTTKSHKKIKNGIVEDRYRILFSLDQVISINKDEYPKFYLHAAGLLGIENVIDLACKDVARMYQPHSQQEVFYANSNNLLSCQQLISSFEEADALNIREKYPNDNEYNSSVESDGTKTGYLRSIIHTDKFLLLMKVEERFVSGNRNNFLFGCGKYLQDNGLDACDIAATLNWINELYDGIPRKELEVLIRGLKL